MGGACACSVPTALPQIKHSNPVLGVFAARTLQKGGATRSYYGALVIHDLSCTKHTKRVFRDGVLKGDIAPFSVCALLVQVQRGRFERATERLGNKEIITEVPALFCACTLINGSRYAKEIKENIQQKKGLLARILLPNVEFQQKKIYTEDDLKDSS